MFWSIPLIFALLSTSQAVPKCGLWTIDECVKDAEICKDKEILLTTIFSSNDNETRKSQIKEELPAGFSSPNLINSIEIVEKSCEQFPQKMKEFFSNLEIIKISKSGMKSVKKSDIEIYPKLKEINLSENEILILESNLFEGNLDVEVINFSGNKIANIGFNFLIPLLKLRDAKFFRNPCINEAHREPFDDLISNLRSKCPTTDELLQRECVTKILKSESLNNEIWKRNGSQPGLQPPASLYAKCTIDNLHFHYNEVERLEREIDNLDGKPEKPRRCNINKINTVRDKNCISSGNYHPIEQRPMSISKYSENGQI